MAETFKSPCPMVKQVIRKMKKLVVGFALAILLLSMVNIGMVAGSKPNSVPPDIQKITFVHYAKSGGHSRPPWDDTEDDFRFLSGGVRWFGTVSYEVNPTGSGLDPDVVLDTLEASMETWDSETSFELFAEPSSTTETSIGYDGENRIVWGAIDVDIILGCFDNVGARFFKRFNIT